MGSQGHSGRYPACSALLRAMARTLSAPAIAGCERCGACRKSASLRTRVGMTSANALQTACPTCRAAHCSAASASKLFARPSPGVQQTSAGASQRQKRRPSGDITKRFRGKFCLCLGQNGAPTQAGGEQWICCTPDCHSLYATGRQTSARGLRRWLYRRFLMTSRSPFCLLQPFWACNGYDGCAHGSLGKHLLLEGRGRWGA